MNKIINIMHIRDSGGIGGGERVLLTLANNLDKTKFNCFLLCMDRGDGKSIFLINKAKNIDIDTINVEVRRKLDIKAIRRIRDIFCTYKIDLFHSHDFKSDFYGLLGSANLPIKRVATAHGSTRDSFLKKAYLYLDENLLYRFFDTIIAVSEDLRAYLERKEIKKERIQVIRNGLDFRLLEDDTNETETDDPFLLRKGHKVFAVIGRLYPDKGHRFFLQAFSRVFCSNQSITGLIVGDGPGRDLITRQVQDLNLEDSVLLCGFRSDMNNVYDCIDFLVIPSLREGLPYVLLEAIAKRIPVLATQVGDIPLLIKHGVTGYLVRPGSADALERSMMELLAHPDIASQMAERAYRLVIEKFSAHRMVTETQNLYLSLFR